MKFKALRQKNGFKEFVTISFQSGTYLLYTHDIPNLMPMTATMEGLKNYYGNYLPPLPEEIKLDDLELIILECTEISDE